MNVMKNKKYTIVNNDITFLKKLDFKHIGEGIYIHDFPVYKWNGFVTITGRFTAYEGSNDITIDVYQEDGHPYAPYYQNSESPVLSIVRSNLNKECKKCNIRSLTNIEN